MMIWWSLPEEELSPFPTLLAHSPTEAQTSHNKLFPNFRAVHALRINSAVKTCLNTKIHLSVKFFITTQIGKTFHSFLIKLLLSGNSYFRQSMLNLNTFIYLNINVFYLTPFHQTPCKCKACIWKVITRPLIKQNVPLPFKYVIVLIFKKNVLLENCNQMLLEARAFAHEIISFAQIVVWFPCS